MRSAPAVRPCLRSAVALAALVVLVAAPAARAAGQAPVDLGVHLAHVSDDGAELDAYTRLVGAKPEIVMLYGSWTEPLYYPNQLQPIVDRGMTPLLTWSPVDEGGGVPMRDIAAGEHDDYLLESARLAADWGKPLLIRFAHEMNLPEAPYGPGVDGNTPRDFVAAWRHVVSVFRDAGVTNVKWVWSPNTWCFGRCPFVDFFPGDEWLDWVGLDGYNYAAVSNVEWHAFTTIFGRSYAMITGLSSKPVMVPETGSAELGGDKAEWIRAAFLTEIPTRFPRIRAVVWFNKVKETDWRVDSSAASLEAWREVVSSPYYNDAAARRAVLSQTREVTFGYFHCRVFGGSPTICGTRAYRNLATRPFSLERAAREARAVS